MIENRNYYYYTESIDQLIAKIDVIETSNKENADKEFEELMLYFEKLIEFKKGKSYDYAAIPRVTVMARQEGDKLHFTVSRHSPSNYPDNKKWQFTKKEARRLCEERFDNKKYYASVPIAVVPAEKTTEYIINMSKKIANEVITHSHKINSKS